VNNPVNNPANNPETKTKIDEKDLKIE